VVETHEDMQPLYRTMLLLGVVAVLIFVLGFAIFLRFQPPGQRTGLHAKVVGVYSYDPAAHQISGPPAVEFRPDQPFAAQVDWQSLPPDVVVAARWYNSLQQPVGGVSPDRASALASQNALVAVSTPEGLRMNLPGSYTLAVIRYSRGQPVELLATKDVQVRPAQ
jgi:hypothetical protein